MQHLVGRSLLNHNDCWHSHLKQTLHFNTPWFPSPPCDWWAALTSEGILLGRFLAPQKDEHSNNTSRLIYCTYIQYMDKESHRHTHTLLAVCVCSMSSHTLPVTALLFQSCVENRSSWQSCEEPSTERWWRRSRKTNDPGCLCKACVWTYCRAFLHLNVS